MLIIDSHIHIHECYDLETFFDSAFNNFSKYSYDSEYQSALCLTESYGANIFEKLKKTAKNNIPIGKYSLNLTNSSNVLKINNKHPLFIISGKQIITKENLEVLAIGLENEYDDGIRIEKVLSDVINSHCIPIIPWGFGKWIGKRKKILENLILNNEYFPIFLGDNGNRTWFLHKSRLFKIAQRKNIFNLQGSDPLPFSREVTKPGSYGIILDDCLDERNPFESLYQILIHTESQFQVYGKLESLLYFLKNQISMQLVKRNRKI